MSRFDSPHGLRYRLAARALHRFNLHHSRRIGPMEDGRFIHRCDWCGLSRMETPRSVCR